MNDQQDERLGQLLRADAPPPRDPMFRLSVLERREEKRFRNRSLMLVGLAMAAALASWFAVSIGGWTFETVSVLIALAIAAIGWWTYAPALRALLRRFR
jgi:hypothetical protein